MIEPRSADAALGGAIADVAMGMVGTRYRFGGTDPVEGFDCSGLVYYAYSQAGYRVPRTSQELFRAVRNLVENALRHCPKGVTITQFCDDNRHVTYLRVIRR